MFRNSCLLLILLNTILFAHDSADPSKGSSAETGPDRGKDNVTAPFGQISDLIIPIIKREGIVGYLKLTIRYQVLNEKEFDVVKAKEPLLRDALFTDLHGALGLLWVGPDAPKAEAVLIRIQRVANKILGENKVKILMRTFYFNPKESK